MARRVANGAPGGLIGRLLRSAMFRVAGGKRDGPYDVTVFGGQRARLHPRDNLSEKRVYRADAAWETRERAAIAAAAASLPDASFHFADIGANAGLYTLAARAAAYVADAAFHAVVVEPQPVMLRRLRTNLALSGAEGAVTVFPSAVTATAEPVRLLSSAGNHGEARLMSAAGGEDADPGAGSITVPGRPLADILGEAGFRRVDVLKIDIEGAERPALDAFFETAPSGLWPKVIIVERESGPAQPLAALLAARGYTLGEETRMNAIWTRAAM
jgi:FkbM family methyltransferase